jgi:uncharacterized membrane protein
MKRKLPWIIVVSALAGAIVQAVMFWPQLPEKVASHFDAGGQADGWMTKTSFIALTLLLQAGLSALMLGLGRIIGALPNSLINIPNKEYWLAEERRSETLDEMIWMMDWIAAGTSVFLFVILYLTFDANVGEEKELNSTVTWIVTVAFSVGLIGFCIVRTMKYYRVPVH